MNTYDSVALKTILSDIIQHNIPDDAWAWLQSATNKSNSFGFNNAFGIMPRKTGKTVIKISSGQQELLNSVRPGFTADGWTADRLCRVWLLTEYKEEDKENYFKTVETLFSVAEMNEQVALYSALPLLPYPELWIKRCAEGIRSNIGTVLEAIMYNNPYPAENLNEAAWNQMILKAFFTEKQTEKIYGLDDRANEELARILIDYAKERFAARRQVNPMLWYLVKKFVSDQQLNKLKISDYQLNNL